jgi:hypothetical protein
MQFNVPPKTTIPAIETNADRYALLISELKLLAEKACTSSSNTIATLEKVRIWNEELLCGYEPSSVNTPPRNEEEEPPPETTIKDWANLQRLLGDRYVCHTDFFSEP